MLRESDGLDEGDMLGERDGLRLGDGDLDGLGETEIDGLTLLDGDVDLLGLVEIDGDGLMLLEIDSDEIERDNEGDILLRARDIEDAPDCRETVGLKNAGATRLAGSDPMLD